MQGRLQIVVSLLVVCFAALIHLRTLEHSLPYPQHVDEPPLMQAAARVLQTSDLNPRMYSYPSLPVYLGTAALVAGVISASGHGPKAVKTEKLGRLTSPYYEQVIAAGMVRKLWWAMGLFTMLAVSALAWKIAGPPGMLLSAAVLAIGVGLPSRAASYINVDTPMTMFAMACLAMLVCSRDPRWPVRVLVPALLCGAAIASKYTAFVLLVPCVAAQWLLHERDRIWASLAIVFAACLAFVLFCPYFVLDMQHFVDGAAFENYHYRVRGHSGFDIQPGWPQLRAYASDMVGEYGVLLVGVAAVGVVEALRADWRSTLVVLSYVVATLAMLSGYKVHFARNLLPIVALVPLFAACGFRGLALALSAGFARVPKSAVNRRARLLAALLLTLSVALFAPWQRLRDIARAKPDSRNEFAAWAAQNFKQPTTVIAPVQMPIDPRTLPSAVTLVTVDLKDGTATATALQPGSLFLRPEWTSAGGWRGRRRAAIGGGVDAIPAHDTLERFGTEPVVPVDGEQVCTDPRFDLVRIR